MVRMFGRVSEIRTATPSGAISVAETRRIFVPERRRLLARPLRMTVPKTRRRRLPAWIENTVTMVGDGASAIGLLSLVAVLTMWADVIIRLG